MKKKIGIVYSTVDGHTLKICNAIARYLQTKGNTVGIFPLGYFNQTITEFDIFVIGASIRHGKHRKEVEKFMDTHQKEMEQILTGIFSFNLVARKEEKNSVLTNPYFIKFIKSREWQPDVIDVFAGYLNYSMYSFVDRIMIQLIMKISKGPTQSDTVIEYTDWNKVRSFSKKLISEDKDLKSIQ